VESGDAKKHACDQSCDKWSAQTSFEGVRSPYADEDLGGKVYRGRGTSEDMIEYSSYCNITCQPSRRYGC
jgi:hypothetical protein